MCQAAPHLTLPEGWLYGRSVLKSRITVSGRLLTIMKPTQPVGLPISHSCPDLGEQEIEALVACVRSLHIKGGVRVQLLERQLADDLGYAGAVATTSGGQAIHLGLRALFAGRTAVVGLPSYVCRSVLDAVLLAGCQPYLLDIDLAHFSVDPIQATQVPLDAVIVPQLFGIRAPLEAFLKLGMPVIDDSAQRIAPLSVGRKEPKAHLRVLSFEATKLLTCGEGGMLLSDDLELLAYARRLRDGPYDFSAPALWLPLTDLQAALALVQWNRLPGFLDKRRSLADFYLAQFAQSAQRYMVPVMSASDTFPFRFLLWVENPDAFLQLSSEMGVVTRRPIAPMPLHELFPSERCFPATEEAFAHLVSIPLYPRLTWEEAQWVATCVSKTLSK